MGGKSRAPAAPNYSALIPEQEASNLRQAQFMLDNSRVNSTTPFGNQTWSRGPDGQWTLNQSLSPEQQGLYSQDLGIRQQMGDIATGMLGNVGQTYGAPANFASEFGDYGVNYDQGTRQRAEDALYGRQTRFLDPQWNQAESRLHDRLVSQGFNTQDDAYGDQMSKFADARTRAYGDARDSAIIGGGQEASQELARAIQAGGYNQSTDMARIGLEQQDRARQLNELNAFRTGGQIQTPGTPNTVQTPNLQGVDRIGVANQQYQAQLGQYNANQAQSSGLMGGLFGLAGATAPYWAPALGAMFSDERLKENIREVGETKGGRKLYTWTWKESGEPGFGVMAQENPDITFKDAATGFLKVDYSEVD